MTDQYARIRDALAPLMCPRHDCESTRHALNQLRVENKHLRAEIERLQRERDELLDIIDGARIYVREFYPQSYEQQSDQDALLARIDAVLPPLPKFEACDNPACCLEKGHAGECDDGIPF